MDIQNIKIEARSRWNIGNFLEKNFPIPKSNYNLPWIPYEDYMEAQLVDTTEGLLGRIIVRFPPEASEDNDLHIHPISDRVITVISGSGQFVCKRPKEKGLSKYELVPGTRVWMPRGVLHTFIASTQGLLVESFHNPFVPFEHPKCLTYQKRRNYEF